MITFFFPVPCIMTDSHMEMWSDLKYDQHKSATWCKADESQREMKNNTEKKPQQCELFFRS